MASWAGQGLVTAQVQLLIGQVGFGLGLGRFGLGQGSIISPAVEAEQRLAFRDFLTALDVFLHDAAGNLRPDGHFVRRRDGTAVLGLTGVSAATTLYVLTATGALVALCWAPQPARSAAMVRTVTLIVANLRFCIIFTFLLFLSIPDS